MIKDLKILLDKIFVKVFIINKFYKNIFNLICQILIKQSYTVNYKLNDI